MNAHVSINVSMIRDSYNKIRERSNENFRSETFQARRASWLVFETAFWHA